MHTCRAGSLAVAGVQPTLAQLLLNCLHNNPSHAAVEEQYVHFKDMQCPNICKLGRSTMGNNGTHYYLS